MTTRNHSRQDEQAFLFTLDVLVQGRNNAQALERLLALLNGASDVVDYRVTSGIQLGRVIDEALRLARQQEPNSPVKAGIAAGAGPGPGVTVVSAVKGGSAAKKETGTLPDKKEQEGVVGRRGTPDNADKPSSDLKEVSPLLSQIYQYIAGRNLVRLTVLKGRGVKLSIPCRLLNYDESADNLTVYHVDEKKVYSVKLAEIDDLTVC